MGIIRSRASKQRDRAQRDLLQEQARQLRGERETAEHEQRAADAGDNPWRQPTVRDALAAAKRRRDGRGNGSGGS